MKNNLFLIFLATLIFTTAKPSNSQAFDGVIVCKNKFGMTTVREFRNNKLVTTKVSTKPGEPFKIEKNFSNLPIYKKGKSIEWKANFIMKGAKYPVTSSIDLSTMSFYTDLNIFNLSSPQKRKVDQTCRKK